MKLLSQIIQILFQTEIISRDNFNTNDLNIIFIHMKPGFVFESNKLYYLGVLIEGSDMITKHLLKIQILNQHNKASEA